MNYSEPQQLRVSKASKVLDGSPLAWYAYDMAGRRTSRQFENGAGDFRTFDGLGRTVAIEHRSLAGVLASLAYTHDAVGNRTSKTTGGMAAPPSAESYTYDPVDQLISAIYLPGQAGGTTRTVAYDYDPVGNRSRVTDNGNATDYAANSLNQYTTVSASGTTLNPSYDPNGNLASLGSSVNALYDAENRLVRAEVDGVVTTFAHDPRGRVVTRTTNGVATTLLYDDWSLVEERNTAGALERFYVHGASIDEVLAQIDATGPLYFHQDALGSTVLVTDETGAAVESYSYDAFGAVTGYDPTTGASLPGTTLKTRFLFTGREWLATTRLYDYRHRAYSPALGRFLQTDPIRFSAGDFNIYRYVGNNPGNWVDPWGLQGSRSNSTTDAEMRRNTAYVAGMSGGLALATAGVPILSVPLGLFATTLWFAERDMHDDDNDNDGIPDIEDSDDDNDGIEDNLDPDPRIPEDNSPC